MRLVLSGTATGTDGADRVAGDVNLCRSPTVCDTEQHWTLRDRDDHERRTTHGLCPSHTLSWLPTGALNSLCSHLT